jgi:hypothetical protein
MEKNTKGKIDLFGIDPNPQLLESVGKQVESWISKKCTILYLPRDAEYRVIIDREDGRNIFGCQINIRIGQSEWVGYETGGTLQSSLTLALRTMQGTVLPFPRIPMQPNPRPTPIAA